MTSMFNRKTRYILFIVFVLMLMAGNVMVHMVSMNMSEKALQYEKHISALKQENLKLESQMVTTSSLQKVAAVATVNGYRSGDTAVRWIAPIVAQR